MPSVLDLIPGVGTVKLIAGGLAVLAVAAVVGWVGYVVEDRKVAWATVQTERVQLDEAGRINADQAAALDRIQQQHIKDDAAIADVSAKAETRTVFVTKTKQEIVHVPEIQTVRDPAIDLVLQRLREREGAAAPAGAH